MRYQGKISKWIDDKGFGFITQDGSNEQIFAHISGFEKGIQRPTVGEVVSYEVASDVKKGLQAYKIQFINRPVRQSRNREQVYKPKNGVNLFKLIGIVMLVMISPYLFKKVANLFENDNLAQHTLVDSTSLQPLQTPQNLPVSNVQNYQCAGKTRCTEMTSCEEAMFYLRNCPGTIADGDGDGIPCEDQWCNH